jgi:hypothetical protein
MPRHPNRSKNPEGNVCKDFKVVKDFIKDFGLEGYCSALPKDDRDDFYSKVHSYTMDKEFVDLRFGELVHPEGYVPYKIKDFKELNSLESRNVLPFIWYMFFSNRVIKLYPKEYETMPEQFKTLIMEDNNFHTRKKLSMMKDKTND